MPSRADSVPESAALLRVARPDTDTGRRIVGSWAKGGAAVVSYQNADDDFDCEAAGRTVFVGNVLLTALAAPPGDDPDAATAVLQIDVISPPGSQTWTFHFVTLELVIHSPAGARFVVHSDRNTYHREVLADPSVALTSNPDALYWVESDAPVTVLRVRDDETGLLSSPGNGHTFYVGIAGLGDGSGPLNFSAAAAGSLVRETTCRLEVLDLGLGESLPGYLDLPKG